MAFYDISYTTNNLNIEIRVSASPTSAQVQRYSYSKQKIISLNKNIVQNTVNLKFVDSVVFDFRLTDTIRVNGGLFVGTTLDDLYNYVKLAVDYTINTIGSIPSNIATTNKQDEQTAELQDIEQEIVNQNAFLQNLDPIFPTSFTYTATGKVDEVVFTDASGNFARRLTFAYDANDRVISITPSFVP